MRRLLFICLMVIQLPYLTAVTFDLGLKVGINFNENKSLQDNGGISSPTNTNPIKTMGATVSQAFDIFGVIGITQFFAVQPQFSYSYFFSETANYDEGNSGALLYHTKSLGHNFYIDVLARFNFGNVYIGLGPSIGFFISNSVVNNYWGVSGAGVERTEDNSSGFALSYTVELGFNPQLGIGRLIAALQMRGFSIPHLRLGYAFPLVKAKS